MKTLVVYYSRTNTTKFLASAIARGLGADVEVLIDAKKRLGPRPIRYLIEDMDARRRKLTNIQVQKSPQDYDLIVIGTPLVREDNAGGEDLPCEPELGGQESGLFLHRRR